MGLITRYVRHRDASNSRNRLLEQFQTFIAHAHKKCGDSSDVSTGMSQGFDKARLHWIGPLAPQDDRDRLGQIHGRLDYCTPACRHDEIDFEANEFGGYFRNSIDFLVGIAEFERNIFSFSLAEVPQGALNSLRTFDVVSASAPDRYPICAVFAGCCASTDEQR